MSQNAISSLAMTHRATAQPEIPLRELQGEARVDSRIIAKHLDVRHRDTFELIKRYVDEFREFGLIPFQTEKIKGRGRPEKFALLNEPQATVLLTYGRNTDRARALKRQLVRAFFEFKNQKAIHDAYLPGYHELHHEIAVLAQRAKEAGSRTDEAIFHININKLVNKTIGIEAGARGQLNPLQKLMVANVQIVIRNAVHRAIQAGQNHRAAYRDARNVAQYFTASAGRLLGVAA